MNLYVGTSGFSYPAWRGTFYPEDLPEKQMLNFYGGRFRSVEINNTFHRMPRPSDLEAWAAQVPADFKFALKVPQRITHRQRLRDCDEDLSYLLGMAGVLRGRLGPLLFQLPPDLPKDLPLLRSVLLSIPTRQFRVAFEFRHSSWFDPELFALLAKYHAALCIAETDDGVEVPPVATADWCYLRLRRSDYGVADLKRWAATLRGEGWQDAYVYFKHEDAGQGPRLASRLLELLG